VNLCCQVNGHNPKHKCSICGQLMCDYCWLQVKRLPNKKYERAIRLLRSSKVFYYHDGRINGVSIKPQFGNCPMHIKINIKKKLSKLGEPQAAGSYMAYGRKITPASYRYYFERKHACNDCYIKEIK